MNQTYTAGQRVKVVELLGLDSPKLIGKHFTVKGFTELMIETMEICLENPLGNWLHKDQVELVEPSFQFTTGSNTTFSVYHPYDGTDEVLITWPEEPTGVIYSSLWVSRYLAKGTWKVVPKECIESLQDGLVTLKECTAEVASDHTLLETIKEFTNSQKASVSIEDGTYIIYHSGGEYYADTDEELLSLMEAVKVLEGAQG
jgi:hypothetical protein